MIPTKVLDDKGEECTVWLLPNFSEQQFVGGGTAVRGALQLPCGDTYMTWFPVFTGWF